MVRIFIGFINWIFVFTYNEKYKNTKIQNCGEGDLLIDC